MMTNALKIRVDLARPEGVNRAADVAMFVAEVFVGEDLLGSDIIEEKAAAGNLVWGLGSCGHLVLQIL
jgi:hypothetical protein